MSDDIEYWMVALPASIGGMANHRIPAFQIDAGIYKPSIYGRSTFVPVRTLQDAEILNRCQPSLSGTS